MFRDWLYRGLVFLVVSCPCALVLSIPLWFFSGIGSSSKQGVLIKGSNYLEALKDVDTVVFDKARTLTKCVFKVTKLTTNSISKEELVEYSAVTEVGTVVHIAVDGEYEGNIVISDEIRADIGIAMGALGSDAAIEAADVVLMTDELSKIAKSVEIARKINRIVK